MQLSCGNFLKQCDFRAGFLLVLLFSEQEENKFTPDLNSDRILRLALLQNTTVCTYCIYL